MDAKLTNIEPIIIPNGVDLNQFKPGKKSDVPMVMYLGRLQQYKSIDVFIKAVSILSRQGVEAKFIIAGQGEVGDRLRKLAKSLKAPIEFVGRVSQEKKIQLYQEAWITVNPSSMEGWGITTIEANACATPMIASNVPGLRDSVRDGYNGYLVEYGNESLLATRIKELLADSKTRETMSNNAVVWASHFDWVTSAQMSIKIIKGDAVSDVLCSRSAKPLNPVLAA
jgi:glycosyltransferase involved in cell wall biosynthesis